MLRAFMSFYVFVCFHYTFCIEKFIDSFRKHIGAGSVWCTESVRCFLIQQWPILNHLQIIVVHVAEKVINEPLMILEIVL